MELRYYGFQIGWVVGVEVVLSVWRLDFLLLVIFRV